MQKLRPDTPVPAQGQLSGEHQGSGCTPTPGFVSAPPSPHPYPCCQDPPRSQISFSRTKGLETLQSRRTHLSSLPLPQEPPSQPTARSQVNRRNCARAFCLPLPLCLKSQTWLVLKGPPVSEVGDKPWQTWEETGGFTLYIGPHGMPCIFINACHHSLKKCRGRARWYNV